MVGIAAGASGLCVLDFDPRIDAETGEEYTLDRLKAELEAQMVCLLPVSVTARTPSGGVHVYFRQPGDGGPQIRNRGNLPRHVDVRGIGGYVIAPPSARGDGFAYRWLRAPTAATIADLPMPLVAILRAPKGASTTDKGARWAQAALRKELDLVRQAADGTRNRQLRDSGYALGTLIGASVLSRGHVEAQLLGLAARWPDQDKSARTIRSALDDGEANPRDLSSIGEAQPARQGNAAPGEGASKSEKPKKERKPPQRDLLIGTALDDDEFFQWDGDVFATVQTGGHCETMPLRSRAYRGHLARRFFERTGGAAGGQGIEDALRVIEQTALAGAPERPASIRIAGYDGAVYLDLANKDWQQVWITSRGWQVIEAAESPVRFVRPRGMRPLPSPVRGGHVSLIREFINLDEDYFVLLAAWLVAALRPQGPYPIAALSGEQGAGKSTAAKFMRRLIDPNVADIRTPPREERDLLVAARNSHILCIDNISELPGLLSDALCRIATGGGFGARQLHTDLDETILAVCRPIILNGIADLTSRPDLADRAVAIHLPAIEPDERRLEAEFWAVFDRQHPKLLGALASAISSALARVDTVSLAELPRMADFARWATAAEPALGLQDGAFRRAFTANVDTLTQSTVDSDQVAAAVFRFAGELSADWEGTASELLDRLRAADPDGRVTNARGFPQAPQALSARIRRVSPALRRRGVKISTARVGHDRRRLITIGARTRADDDL